MSGSILTKYEAVGRGLLSGAALLVLAAAAPTGGPSEAGLAEFRTGRFAEAMQSWSQAAEAGDTRAGLYLGVLYDTGAGVAQDFGQALAWYRRSAEAGNPTAMLNAAVMYDAGRGTPADPARAAEWYQRAAEQGSGRAAYNLGLMYEQGSGVPADRGQAIRYFSAAVRQGVPAGRAHLVRLGVGVPAAGSAQRPMDPAMQAFQQAQRVLLTRGVAEAQQAVELFRSAAEKGNALAEYDLGYCYEHGIGVTADVAQAIIWYRRAAAHAAPGEVRNIAEAGARNLANQVSHALK